MPHFENKTEIKYQINFLGIVKFNSVTTDTFLSAQMFTDEPTLIPFHNCNETL